MVSKTDVQDRIDRAGAEAIEFSRVQTDPLVLLAENEDSDTDTNTPYTVVPNALHCGCPDHIFRVGLCKHLLALGLMDDWRGELVRERIEAEYQTLVDERASIRERLTEIEEQIEAFEPIQEQMAPDDQRPTEYAVGTESQEHDQEGFAQMISQMQAQGGDGQ